MDCRFASSSDELEDAALETLETNWQGDGSDPDLYIGPQTAICLTQTQGLESVATGCCPVYSRGVSVSGWSTT